MKDIDVRNLKIAKIRFKKYLSNKYNKKIYYFNTFLDDLVEDEIVVVADRFGFHTGKVVGYVSLEEFDVINEFNIFPTAFVVSRVDVSKHSDNVKFLRKYLEEEERKEKEKKWLGGIKFE